MSISTMKGSKYARAFEQELDTWDAVLSQVSEGIEIILNSQRAWMYLETILPPLMISVSSFRQSPSFSTRPMNFEEVHDTHSP